MSEPVLAEAIGTIDGVNVDFTTPSAYFAGTVFAYKNGLLIRAIDDDGPIELGTNQVRMKEAPRTGDTLHFYYDTQPPVGGGFYGPPDIYQALELMPENYTILLAPDVFDAINESPTENVPENYSNVELKPETITVELVPDIISAEEVS